VVLLKEMGSIMSFSQEIKKTPKIRARVNRYFMITRFKGTLLL